MARKNLIGITITSDEKTVEQQQTPLSQSRPLAGLVPSASRAGMPVGGIAKSIGQIAQTVERSHGLEKQLSEGLTVIEIDPALVDGSFVSDRLAFDSEELSILAAQIRDHGQQVPILVRPHPETKGRYQVAYGHRRLAAVKSLGLKVKAVVKALTDEQLVVSQGQENNARTNLSYIERALFAARLEDKGFSRDVIMSALGVDKAALSKMLSVIRQVPLDIVQAIGPAVEIGRRRWMELAQLLVPERLAEIIAFAKSDAVQAVSSDQRFQAVLDRLIRKPGPKTTVAPAQTWQSDDKRVVVNVKTSGKNTTIAMGAAEGVRFASYVTGQLEALYAAFRKTETEDSGD